MDGSLLVVNEGIHGPVEQCGQQALTSGSHTVYIEGFQAYGGVDMEARFSGPDTDGKKVLQMSGRASGRCVQSCQASVRL